MPVATKPDGHRITYDANNASLADLVPWTLKPPLTHSAASPANDLLRQTKHNIERVDLELLVQYVPY
jgi:hypothetical protein